MIKPAFWVGAGSVGARLHCPAVTHTPLPGDLAWAEEHAGVGLPAAPGNEAAGISAVPSADAVGAISQDYFQFSVNM